MYIKDKNGKRYEYRQKLEKFEGQKVTLKAEIYGTKFQGNCQKAELHKIFMDNNFVCNHIHSDIKKSLVKIIKNNIGKKIIFEGKCKKYTNKKGQLNFEVDIRNIISIEE